MSTTSVPAAILLPLFDWLGDTAVGGWMHHSRWAFAVAETLHLLGLASLGGAIVLVELRTLGAVRGRLAPSQWYRQLRPWLLVNLALLAVTGALMVSSAPRKYYYNDPFALKMALLAAALSSMPLLHGAPARASAAADLAAAPWSRLRASVSLALWFGVALCGRVIGLL